MGRSRANDRRSALTVYWRDGKVTFRPPPVRRSQMANPISFRPGRESALSKCSSASASFPAGDPLSLVTILTVISWCLLPGFGMNPVGHQYADGAGRFNPVPERVWRVAGVPSAVVLA